MARSYLPVLQGARDLTVTVSPVLADQLEAPGVAERMAAFVRRYRLGAAERDDRRGVARASVRGGGGGGALPSSARRVWRRSRATCSRRSGSRARIEASRCCPRRPRTRCSRSSPRRRAGGCRSTPGLRSHRRRFGAADGFWLPECAYRPDVEPFLAERGLRFFCVDQSAFEDAARGAGPSSLGGGLVAFTLDWDAVQLVWSERGYPSDPSYAEFHRQSLEGSRLWSIGGAPYDAEAATQRADRHAREFAQAIAARLAAFRERRGKPGLVTFAVDTELLGHWWSGGPRLAEGVVSQVAEQGVRLVTLPQALARHQPEERPLRESTWGEGKDLRTWDSPDVADLAWGPRRLELRLLRRLEGGELAPRAAHRAARELLAVQASDWAFLDRRRQAGEYPFQRATAHSRALLDALHATEPPEPRLRNLAPDLSLAPLMEP